MKFKNLANQRTEQNHTPVRFTNEIAQQ